MLGISTDTFFALKAWDDQQHFGFPLLSDYNKDVISSYGVVNPDMIGFKDIAKRAVFVIDKGGVVRYREVLDDARNEPDYGKLSEALLQLPSDDAHAGDAQAVNGFHAQRPRAGLHRVADFRPCARGVRA